MQFRTELNIPVATHPIDYTQTIWSLGSCFADTMGQKLVENKFQVINNPFGVIFNPVALFGLVEILEEGQRNPETLAQFIEQGLVQNTSEQWYHYQLHSSIHRNTAAQLKDFLITYLTDLHTKWQQSNWVLITLGTAWVYEHTVNQQVVANCHKMPATLFQKRLLTVEEILKAFGRIASFLSTKQVVITVSPVRHLKDTLPLNSVSKAVLRLACHQLTERYENIHYFPSYELLLDDLRDYRFYTDDLLHPNKQAQTYIWERFVKCFFTEATQKQMQQWQKIRNALQHRPFHPESKQYQQFLRKLYQEMQAFHPAVDLTEELAQVKQQLL
ncbi:MAG: GSCFA domain-containing protein [Thermonemataceae bacterium]